MDLRDDMHRQSPRFNRICLYLLALAIWIGANCAALAWIDRYESEVLEDEFHVAASVIGNYESRTAVVPLKRSQTSASISYRFRPPESTGGTRAVPLVVYLHGGGACGSENARQLQGLPSLLCEVPMRKKYPCAVLAPQCPQPGGWSQLLDRETDFLDVVLRMIEDVLNDSRIDANRIYLTGGSMGGNGTWELAMLAPDRFAAVVPICGWGDESRAMRLVNLSVWAVHGTSDEVVPVSQTRRMIAALESAGGKPRYLELPGVGHNSWEAVYRPDSDVLMWMFQQARHSSSAPTSPH